MKTIILILLFATVTLASPVTIQELDAQDPQPATGTVTLTVIEECCEEDESGLVWWPWLAGASAVVPFIFINRDRAPEIMPPASVPTPVTTTEPIPEPPTVTLGLLAVAALTIWRRRR